MPFRSAWEQLVIDALFAAVVNDLFHAVRIRDPIDFDFDPRLAGTRNPDGAYSENPLEERLADDDVPHVLVKDIIGEFRQDAAPQRRLFVRDRQRRTNATDVPNQQNHEPDAHET